MDGNSISGFNADDLGVVLGTIADNMVDHLDEIDLTGFDKADYDVVLKNIASAVLSNIDNVDLEGLDESDMATLIESFTRKMVGSLDAVEEGLDGNDISNLAGDIAEGATSAIDNVSMSGYDADDVATMAGAVATGAIKGLGDINGITTFDATEVIDAIDSVMTGINDGLDDINMEGFDSSDVNTVQAAMATSVKSAGTSILSNFSGLTQTAIDTKANTKQTSLPDPTVTYTAGATKEAWDEADED